MFNFKRHGLVRQMPVILDGIADVKMIGRL
jgi:hypothetical protein